MTHWHARGLRVAPPFTAKMSVNWCTRIKQVYATYTIRRNSTVALIYFARYKLAFAIVTSILRLGKDRKQLSRAAKEMGVESLVSCVHKIEMLAIIRIHAASHRNRASLYHTKTQLSWPRCSAAIQGSLKRYTMEDNLSGASFLGWCSFKTHLTTTVIAVGV